MLHVVLYLFRKVAFLATVLIVVLSLALVCVAAPNITSLSTSSGPVGTPVTINGSGFGATQGSSMVGFHNVNATVTSWSNTAISVTVPSAATTGNVLVRVNGVNSNAVVFTVTPEITNLSTTSGLVGTAVTITGTTFGTTQGSSTVTFNGATAIATTWSATSIAVTVPAAATTGNVIVTVSGNPSNGVAFTVTPSITSLSTTSGPVGTPVTISGSGFGASQGSSIVGFHNTSATVTSWSDASISVTVPSGATTGNVIVRVGGVNSNAVVFTVTPQITSLSPTSGSPGTAVTIHGTTFGTTQGSSTVTFNGAGASVTSWAAGAIAVTVPTGATTGNVVVTVGGNPSNGVLFTVAGTPSITSLSTTSGAVSAPVTITGTNFGTNQGSSTVTFNGTNAPVTNWTTTSISVQVPFGATSGNVVVTVTGIASNGVSFTVLPTPSLTGVSPNLGSVGTTVTISGNNLGSSQGNSALTFNGVASSPTTWNSTSVAVPVPMGATTGNVVATVGGVGSNGVLFTVGSAPNILSLSPSSGAVGSVVTINGGNFGSVQGNSRVTFNGVSAATTTWTPSSIVATVPTGATTGNVVVTVGGVASNGSSFTVTTTPPASPSITAMSPTAGPVGAQVEISGSNFGSAQGSSSVTFNGTSATPTWWSPGYIVVTVPPGATTGSVVLMVGGSSSNSITFTIGAAPVISTIQALVSDGNGAAGAPITINGTNFGSSPGTSIVTFNGAATSTTTWSPTSIGLNIPATAPMGPAIVTVTVNNMTASSYPYAPLFVGPSITSITPEVDEPGASVTVTGTNFGATQGSSSLCYNSPYCTTIPVTSWSNSSIVFTVPSGLTNNSIYVAIPYAGYSNGVNSNAFPIIIGTPPAITSISPSSGAVGLPVTIAGTNFNSAGTPVVTFNGTAARLNSYTATSIATTVPAGATTGNVIVDANGHGATSNGEPFTVSMGPAITTVGPTTGGIGTLVEVFGAGFGSSQGASTLTFNGVTAPASSIEAWGPSEILAPIPVGATTGNVVVTVGGVVSNGIPITVITTPSIQYISPSSGYIGESTTIQGYDFGNSQGSSTITFNGIPGSPSYWSPTDITTPVPVGATTGNVVITVGGTPTGGVAFTVTPGITTVSPTLAPVGASVTITGTNFGATQGTSTITFGSTNGIPTSWNNSQIIVPVPSGISGYNSVYVKVNGVYSNSISLFVGATPSITSISPTSGPVGSPVTINGNNFYGAGITFNGVGAQIASWTSTMIIAYVPSGATTGNVVDTLSGVASNGVTFTVTSGPGVGSLQPTTGAVGASIFVNGGNFGASQGASTVTFNGTAATTITEWSTTGFLVSVPTGASTGNVVVTVGGVASNPVPFTVVPAATITSTTPQTAAGGNPTVPLTINGTNFGATAGRIYFGTSSLIVNSWTNTSITTDLYSGQGAATNYITVVANGTGVPSNGMLFTVLGFPDIGNISPSSGTVGTTITVTAQPGFSFGATQSSNTVSFNGALAAPTSWSDTSIAVPVPAGASTGYVVVNENGASSNQGGTTAIFIVEPTIGSVSPSNGVTNQVVTINGTGFGPTMTDNTPYYCSVNNNSVSSVSVNGAGTHPLSWTPSVITVPIPNLATAGTGSVVVTTCGNQSNGMPFTVTTGTTGTVSGTVTNALTTMPVSGVTVAALQSGITIASTLTATNGTYSIANLAAGSYDIQVTGTGYITVLDTSNTVTAGNTTAVNLALSTSPLVSTVSPIWGGTGTSVTISGSNFGLNQADSTGSITFNGVAGTPSTWNNNSIVVPVPSGATTGAVVVSVGGVASAPTTFNVGGGSLTGTITNASTGQAVNGAVIIALLGNAVQGTTTSSANGGYTLSNLGPGTYDIVVSASGLGSTDTPGQAVTVGNATTVNVALPAAGSDSGTVTNGTSGISGATVSALQNGDVVSTSTTNASGNFTMSNLSAGTYAVQASAQGYSLQTASGVAISAGNNTTTNFSLTGQSTISYEYDTLGRLVGVVDSLNGSAVYNYDPVGNVTSIQRLSASQVGIVSFTPSAGIVGTTVTIYGTNFSSTAGQNGVTFNGVSATVSTASSTQLVVTLPAGATSGPIQVTAPGGVATSANSFTVLTATSAPTITGISPSIAASGQTITITGTNFDPNPANDNVMLGGILPLSLSSASSTTLTFALPSNATTGQISVSNAAGTVTSSNYLFVVPSQYSLNEVAYTGAISSLPGSQNVSLGNSQVGILAFNAIAGQTITLATTVQNFPNICTVPALLLNPLGTTLYSGSCFGWYGDTFESTPLALTGTYSLILGPDSQSAGNETIAVGNVSPAAIGYLWLDGSTGPTVPVSIQTWGQNGMFAFNATAQQTATIHVSQNTIPGMNLNVFSPNGTKLASASQTGSSFTLSVGTLPMTGSYLVQIVPNAGTQNIGTLNLSVTTP